MVHSYKGDDAENVEQVGSHTSSARKGGRVKRHCAKWWWLHLAIFCAITLGLTLGLVYGGIPSIGQKTINKSTLTVEGIRITDPTNQNFTFGMNSTIHGSVPVKSHLGPQQLAMYLVRPDGTKGNTFMKLNMTKLDLHNTTPVNVTNYPMNIVDLTAYTEFTTALLGSKNVTMGVSSKPDLFVGSIKNSMNFEKTVNLTGFNKLEGIRLYDAQLFKKRQDDGTNMITQCTIPNPSLFTLQMGDLAMNFSSTLPGSTTPVPIGLGVVSNLILHPGDNNVVVKSNITDLNFSLLQAGFELGGLNVTLLGNSVVYGGTHLSWLEIPLRATNITVPAPNEVNSTTSS